MSNCEVYNWKELGKRFGIKAENDSEMLFRLFEEGILPEKIEELDGDHAVGYVDKHKAIVARDNMGVKPVWYSEKRLGKKEFAKAPEVAKAVEQVVGEESKAVEDFSKGKVAVVGYLLGQVQKKLKGTGEPTLINKLLLKRLQGG